MTLQRRAACLCWREVAKIKVCVLCFFMFFFFPSPELREVLSTHRN